MTPDDPLTPGQIAMAACLLEAAARKPGNVHRYADFDDATFLDFALSAGAIAGPMDRAPGRGLGATILEAVAATRVLVGTNTNLGMVLLLAPLAAVPMGEDFRGGVAAILDRTTVEDAELAYRAIRLASPGGLGAAPEGQDVAGAPTVTLRDAMRLAADRDLVARQYATGFADVFDRFVPDLAAGLAVPGRTLEEAIVEATLRFLAASPDTLIARKLGTGVAQEASRRAAAVVRSGWPDAPGSAAALADLDAWLRAEGRARNPGATADLAAAGLFVAIRAGVVPRPIATRWDPGPFAPR